MPKSTIPFHISSGQYAVRATYIQIGNEWYPEYIGEFAPCDQNKILQPVCRIKKVSYDANGNAISTLFANGCAKFNKIWANATSYTY